MRDRNNQLTMNKPFSLEANKSFEMNCLDCQKPFMTNKEVPPPTCKHCRREQKIKMLKNDIEVLVKQSEATDADIEILKQRSKDIKEEAGQRLRSLRKATGLSASTLNAMLKKSRGVTGQMEQGRASMDTIHKTMEEYIKASEYFYAFD